MESCHQSTTHTHTHTHRVRKTQLVDIVLGAYFTTCTLQITNKLFCMLTSAPLLISNSTRDFLLEEVAQCYSVVQETQNNYKQSEFMSERERDRGVRGYIPEVSPW